ncbi:hypothetical protein [Catenuloplanes japonicus]|uniref:hypothetical protein n=1 Tax=Catenuloplanes japonicus TaxID=33876 RepID=UPI0005261DAC|nr:hypothetical protein [Catenuloplanes japonicus]
MTASTALDWYAWHAPYDELVSPLTRRLALVQDRVRAFLDTAPDGGLRVVSLAAGQSRDLLPLLIEHPRGADVRARLVELDPRNADFAEGAALSARLAGVDIVVGDAGLVGAFTGALPAGLVLACGLFDTISPGDVPTTVATLPQLCAPGATLVWTAGALPAPLTATVRELLAEAGFTEATIDAGAVTPDGADAPVEFTVGTAILTGPPASPVAETRMFQLR